MEFNKKRQGGLKWNLDLVDEEEEGNEYLKQRIDEKTEKQPDKHSLGMKDRFDYHNRSILHGGLERRMKSVEESDREYTNLESITLDGGETPYKKEKQKRSSMSKRSPNTLQEQIAGVKRQGGGESKDLPHKAQTQSKEKETDKEKLKNELEMSWAKYSQSIGRSQSFRKRSISTPYNKYIHTYSFILYLISIYLFIYLVYVFVCLFAYLLVW
jgi:hypothetical protein